MTFLQGGRVRSRRGATGAGTVRGLSQRVCRGPWACVVCPTLGNSVHFRQGLTGGVGVRWLCSREGAGAGGWIVSPGVTPPPPAGSRMPTLQDRPGFAGRGAGALWGGGAPGRADAEPSRGAPLQRRPGLA